MSNTKKLLDDLFKLTGSAMNTAMHSAGEAKQQMEQWVHSYVKDALSRYDLIEREEFEAVRKMAEQARKENTALKKRLTALEKKIEEEGKTND